MLARHFWIRGRRPGGRRPGGRAQAGFSLLELLVTMIILLEIMVGMLILFDTSTKLARAQTHLSELQQSLRVGQAEIVRFVRMAGIGGLPITRLNVPDAACPSGAAPDYSGFPGLFPNGTAIAVINNVAEGATVVTVSGAGSAPDGTDLVLPGSDVLIVRGVFTSPVYYTNSTPPPDIRGWVNNSGTKMEAINNDDVTGSTLPIVLKNRVRIQGTEGEGWVQKVAPLAERLNQARLAERPEAILLRDLLNPNAFVVMEFDWRNTSLADLNPTACGEEQHGFDDTDAAIHADRIAGCTTFAVKLDPDEAPGEGYLDLTESTMLRIGGPESQVNGVPIPRTYGSLGILEEFRFYVRVKYEDPDDPSSPLIPELVRARFLPGTNTQVEEAVIADNVIDLQIAVGIDVHQQVAEGENPDYGRVTEDPGTDDEVLFNDSSDTEVSGDLKLPPQTAGVPCSWFDTAVEYHFLRINTVVQTPYPDKEHLAPLLVEIEDYNRGEPFQVNGVIFKYNEHESRYFRRRWLQTTVELRNLL